MNRSCDEVIAALSLISLSHPDDFTIYTREEDKCNMNDIKSHCDFVFIRKIIILINSCKIENNSKWKKYVFHLLMKIRHRIRTLRTTPNMYNRYINLKNFVMNGFLHTLKRKNEVCYIIAEIQFLRSRKLLPF